VAPWYVCDFASLHLRSSFPSQCRSGDDPESTALSVRVATMAITSDRAPNRPCRRRARAMPATFWSAIDQGRFPGNRGNPEVEPIFSPMASGEPKRMSVLGRTRRRLCLVLPPGRRLRTVTAAE
jgi:hypothetical protein